MGGLLKLTGVFALGLLSGLGVGYAWRRHRFVSIDCPTNKERSEAQDFMRSAGATHNPESGTWEVS